VAPERDAVGRGAVRAAIENDTVLSTAIFQERVRVRAPGGIVSLNNHSELAAVPSGSPWEIATGAGAPGVALYLCDSPLDGGGFGPSSRRRRSLTERDVPQRRKGVLEKRPYPRGD
jgi:hypothetical protein